MAAWFFLRIASRAIRVVTLRYWLHYLFEWQGKKDSNLRMLESKSSALTDLAIPLRNLVFVVMCRAMTGGQFHVQTKLVMLIIPANFYYSVPEY